MGVKIIANFRIIMQNSKKVTDFIQKIRKILISQLIRHFDEPVDSRHAAQKCACKQEPRFCKSKVLVGKIACNGRNANVQEYLNAEGRVFEVIVHILWGN